MSERWFVITGPGESREAETETLAIVIAAFTGAKWVIRIADCVVEYRSVRVTRVC